MSVRKNAAAFAALLTALAGRASVALADPVVSMPEAGKLGMQHAYSPVAVQLENFHSLLLYIIIGIVAFVSLLLLTVMVRFNRRANPVPSKTSHHTLLEVAWTVVPVLILVIVAVPSFRVLYYGDRTPNPELTVKITGHQWYWSYEYPDNNDIAFDSNIVSDSDLKPGQPRLLTVDNEMVVPVGTPVRLLLTGADVIHSWYVPSLGVQLHAVPGRINETWLQASVEGTFYGQCTLICGTNHGFMPIVVHAVSKEDYKAWAEKTKTAGIDAGREFLASLEAAKAGATKTALATDNGAAR
ncbi:cytochrome c oxidase subunit II [Nitrospirillum pindoramense]|uniref:Cytochrome c oxidase subunit 2 n=1 Tax=Nitrospirillum amazonense TaxID=28077 RepID=A0A560HFX7_9PROT|nr:cytochrome c oxidase subunit II [Nitrospirillum amazonense]TWB45335.1 cytochrome c oxidase subunit 2 [Nitrospirillum amazonense]